MQAKKKKKHEIIKMEANLQRATITTPKLIKYEKLVNSKKVGNQKKFNPLTKQKLEL